MAIEKELLDRDEDIKKQEKTIATLSLCHFALCHSAAGEKNENPHR